MTYHLLLTFNPLASVSNRAPSITITETLFLPGHLYMSPPLPAVSWAAAALSQSHGFVVLFFCLFSIATFPTGLSYDLLLGFLGQGTWRFASLQAKINITAYCWQHFFATFFASLLFVPCLLAACLQRHLRMQQLEPFQIIRHTKDPTRTITATPVLLQGPQDASAYPRAVTSPPLFPHLCQNILHQAPVATAALEAFRSRPIPYNDNGY